MTVQVLYKDYTAIILAAYTAQIFLKKSAPKQIQN